MQSLRAYRDALSRKPEHPEIRRKIEELERLVNFKPPQLEVEPELEVRNKVSAPDPVETKPKSIPNEQYEWIVDCYRMRLEDDCIWAGGATHGLYQLDATGASITADFFVFCKMAHKSSSIPEPWNWEEFLKIAAQLLPESLERRSASKKWGANRLSNSEDSLRSIGEKIYLTTAGSTRRESDELVKLNNLVKKKKWVGLTSQSQLFDDIGGVQIWRTLEKTVTDNIVRRSEVY